MLIYIFLELNFKIVESKIIYRSIDDFLLLISNSQYDINNNIVKSIDLLFTVSL